MRHAHPWLWCDAVQATFLCQRDLLQRKNFRPRCDEKMTVGARAGFSFPFRMPIFGPELSGKSYRWH
jgi:hypothetical protein